MMQIITLSEIKAHCRLDGNAEDTILQLYGESAEQTVLNLLQRSMDEIYDSYGEIPAAIKHATLLLVDHSYAQRSPASPQQLYNVPYAIDGLIKPYMSL